jgi:hypothetical protein
MRNKMQILHEKDIQVIVDWLLQQKKMTFHMVTYLCNYASCDEASYKKIFSRYYAQTSSSSLNPVERAHKFWQCIERGKADRNDNDKKLYDTAVDKCAPILRGFQRLMAKVLNEKSAKE